MRLGHVVAFATLLTVTGCCRVQVVDRVENPTSGEKALDLFTTGAPDDNGLPLAPRWKHQWDGKGIPNPALLCKERPDGKLDFGRCTSQKPQLDVAAGFADAICAVGASDDIRGHVNWWPVTYNGRLWWDEASIDLDYTFSFRPDGGGALVTRNGDALHVEFDSSETVWFFDTPWWNALREAAAESKAAARGVVDRRRAVLTGLYGLDCEHHCHAEIHPVYLFALQVKDAPEDDTWAFFLRNSGNEGFCSRYMHSLPLETVAIRIPWRCGATAVALAPGTIVKKSRGLGADLRIVSAANEGVVLAADLPPAKASEGVLHRVHGEIHLTWTMGAPCAEVERAIAPPAERAEEEEENDPERRLEALPAPEAPTPEAAPSAAPARRDDVTLTPKMETAPTLPPKPRASASARVEDATPKLQRDEAVLRARCEAAKARPGGAPPECEPVLRDRK